MNIFLKTMIVLIVLVAMAAPAMAAEFAFHGDLNNRFNLYTNHSEFYSGAKLEKGYADTKINGKKNTNTTWGDIKYRFWTEAATNDNKVKGVLGVELGAIRFGDSTKGGAFSGDGKNFEIRWAYTQFQTPGVEGKSLVTIGLQPYKVNSFLWAETAMGVKYTTDNYELAWMRGKELFNKDNGDSNESLDSLSARYNLKPAEGVKLGLFGLYQHENASKTSSTIDAGKYEVKSLGDVDMNLYSFGVDGGMTIDNLFVNWDGIYQVGEFNNTAFQGLNGTATGDFDLSAFLLHADVGMKMGASKLTYTTWYASGDDDSADGDFDAFISTDVDRFESIVLFEGGYTDDNYATERPYLLDKGLFLNKLAYDRQQNEKLKFGAAVLYMETAEDIEYLDNNGKSQSESSLGFELDAYVSYKLYPNVELALNGGYLIAGDAMDAFEIDRDGNADEDIYRITSRVRVNF